MSSSLEVEISIMVFFRGLRNICIFPLKAVEDRELKGNAGHAETKLENTKTDCIWANLKMSTERFFKFISVCMLRNQP